MKRAALMLLAIVTLLGGCEVRQIEYRRRPEWVTLMGGDLPAVTIDKDGTEIHWIEDQSRSLQGFEQTIGEERVLIREDAEDGSVTLRTVLPAHLTVNLLECLRRGEYEIIYQQLISTEKRDWYESKGEAGYEEFLAWFRQNRKDIGSTLNRMKIGKVFGDVEIHTHGDRGTIGLQPRVAYDFRVKSFDIVREEGDWKLAGVN